MFKLHQWFWPSRPAAESPAWEAYAGHFSKRQNLRMPMETQRFVVLDTETTGLNPKLDRILCVGAIAVQNWQIRMQDSLEIYVRQNYAPAQGEVAIHGILPVEKANMVEEADAIYKFLNYVGDAILIGHHIRFDVSILNQALKRLHLPALKNKIADTHRLAQRVHPPTDGLLHPGNYGLDKLCEQYKIPTSDRHTAAGDAYITAILFLKLLAHLKLRGIRTVADVLR